MELKCSSILERLRIAERELDQALEDGVHARSFRNAVSEIDAELIKAKQADPFDYILASTPDLNLNGFRMPADSNSLHEGLRQDLWEHRGAFDACCRLLAGAERVKYTQSRCSSIGLCQAAEVSTGIQVPHGVMIAAALAKNFHVRPVPFTHYALIHVERQWMIDLILQGEEARLRDADARMAFGLGMPRPGDAASYRSDVVRLALVAGGSHQAASPEPDDLSDVF